MSLYAEQIYDKFLHDFFNSISYVASNCKITRITKCNDLQETGLTLYKLCMTSQHLPKVTDENW
jgi:hypothetical protein